MAMGPKNHGTCIQYRRKPEKLEHGRPRTPRQGNQIHDPRSNFLESTISIQEHLQKPQWNPPAVTGQTSCSMRVLQPYGRETSINDPILTLQ